MFQLFVRAKAYTNDLYCRNWLHEAWILLDEHIVQLWTPRIKALDDRYRAATVDGDGQALDQFRREQTCTSRSPATHAG
ncbi:hypothetical protein [Streptomyces sp. NPDC057552]|uniref:hypothetical protein n=1 Tax=Streptomycetaceae TaxID=2062 RepID=UPI001FC9F252